MTTAAPARRRPRKRRSDSTTRRGHGRRLIEAVEAFESFPALSCARGELLGLLNRGARTEEIVLVIESDAALTMAVLRLANADRSSRRRALCAIPNAVAAIPVEDLLRVVDRIPTFELLGRGGPWAAAAQRFRLHATATVRAAERLIEAGHSDNPGELRVTALLHDIGKLALGQAHEYTAEDGGGSPEARLLAERRRWGLDHALIGGVVARRLDMPESVATMIERHHTDDAKAAVLRVADMLAHYLAGDPVDLDELVSSATTFGLAGARLDAVLWRPLGVPIRGDEHAQISSTRAIVVPAVVQHPESTADTVDMTPSDCRS